MKTIKVDRELLVTLIKKTCDGHIPYKMGGKALSLDCDSSVLGEDVHGVMRGIDCSGFVRYILHRISNVDMPDGSWNQRDWCQKQGFKVCPYSDCAKKDDILRIAFLNKENDDAGHVWLIISGMTIESHGRSKVNGVWQDGPSRRPWNWKSLKSKVDFCFEMTLPMS